MQMASKSHAEVPEIVFAINAAAKAKERGASPWEAYEVGKKLLPPFLSSGLYERAIQLVAEAAGL